MEENKRNCLRCGWIWIKIKQEEPLICPNCKTAYWNKPKQTLTKEDQQIRQQKNRGYKK